MRTVTIAEIGSCHDGDLNKAIDLIYAARDAGAQYVKAQFWSSAQRLAQRRHSGIAYEAIYSKYQIPADWLPVLAERTRATGLGFMCTSYVEEDIAVVAPYVAHFKCASFEAADMAFIQAHYPYLEGKPDRWLIVSTGLQDNTTLTTLKIERHAAGLRGTRSVTMKLLHCVSAYPAPVESLNLRQIRWEEFDGFSDHAAVAWTASGAVAVACGAKILEVHLKLPETDPQNPDAPHALLPAQLERYIKHVRAAEAAIGDEPWRKPNPTEDEMRKYRVQP